MPGVGEMRMRPCFFRIRFPLRTGKLRQSRENLLLTAIIFITQILQKTMKNIQE